MGLSPQATDVSPLEAFAARLTTGGRKPFAFQVETWRAYLGGESGLVHAPTGSGKTLAVVGGPVIERLGEPLHTASKRSRDTTDPFRLIWITPMRALATDTAHAITKLAAECDLNWSVEVRSSDTTATTRKKQRDRLPTVLVTTPESLSLLISYPDLQQKLIGLRAAIVDEWHELLSTKRGVQTELGLARLRTLNPHIRTWGLSATLGNLDQAKDALLGPTRPGRMIHADLPKETRVESLVPQSIERFAWAGHVGLKMLKPVIEEIEKPGTTLVFANTRAQTEIWFRAILDKRPDWLGQIAIHHGSLDRKLRLQVEQLLRESKIRAVVCTSSLDLGVDFTAVDRVLQIGSPKGIARLMQRAGRSGHRPGEVSRVICVPTHAFELVEFSAAREGVEHRRIESRHPLRKPLDLLVQHLVTVATGVAFDEETLKAELRSTHAYADLTDEEWGWSLDFVARGGPTLTAYPQFQKVVRDESSRWTIGNDKLARMHRLGIGTITGDGVISLVTTGNKKLGTIEEQFIGKLKPGDVFVFSGRPLELVSVRQMTAKVKLTTGRRGSVAVWGGGRFPMSTMLAGGVRKRLDEAREGVFEDAEMQRVAPLLMIQKEWSALPAPHELLIEYHETREGHHYFLFGFLGRLVHEGLGALIGYRLKERSGVPVVATYTDYGLELLCPSSVNLSESDWRELLSTNHLLDDLLTCLNAGQLARRQFREIARVAGLVLASSPGAPRSMRQLQASAELFYDVFADFDPKNLLLEQARREVLEQQLEVSRLKHALETIERQTISIKHPQRLTPMAFTIWAQRISSQTIRVEEAGERIERMIAQLEAAADQTHREDAKDAKTTRRKTKIS
jgi:ATP-dependent helicase Lhr and Lhr-like helicase